MSHAYEVSQERLDELARRSAQGFNTPDAWDILTATKELVEALYDEVQELRAEVERLKGLHGVDTQHGRDIHEDEEDY